MGGKGEGWARRDERLAHLISRRLFHGFFGRTARESVLIWYRTDPMSNAFLNHLSSELEALKSAGLYKSERVIVSPQSSSAWFQRSS